MRLPASSLGSFSIKKPTRRNLVAALLLAAVVYFAAPTPGCGPFLPDAIFTYALHPDFPLVKYARGELGIIQPSYARSYLVVAYRNLSGTRLSALEEQAALNLWEERLTSGWFPFRPVPEKKTVIQRWLDERTKVPGAAKAELNAGDPIGITRAASQPYQSFYNCLPEAFSAATSTLDQLIGKFGADSPELKAWLTAQDQVFANCADRPANSIAIIPSALAPGGNPLLESDRAYQIASAYFYSEDFAKAEKLFAGIANDHSSPWRKTAALLVARTYIREATLGAKDNEVNYAPLAKAKAQLKSILSDNDLAEVHPAAERLLGFVEFRLHPRERLLELSAALSRKDGSANFKQDLTDYTMLLDEWGKLSSDPTAGGPPKEPSIDPEKSLADLRAASDMTDWILTMQSPGPDSAAHAVARWHEMHSSPWLVAALATIAPDDPQAAAIAAAALNTSPDSAAFATITFHRARIQTNSGKQDAAREELDHALEAARENFPPSSLNLVLAQRFKLARNFDEFLKYAPRDAAGIVTFSGNLELPDDKAFENAFSTDENAYQPEPQPPLFDADSVRLLNRQLPLEMLQRGANSNALPENLRAQIAEVAWVRAIVLGHVPGGVLGDDAAAQALAPVAVSLNPALKTGLDEFSTEKNSDARHFAAVVAILRNPALRPNATAGVPRREKTDAIDSYRDNWWCAAVEPRDTGNQGGGSGWAPSLSEPLRAIYSGDHSAVLSFLGDADKKSAATEWQRLVSAGSAPDYLTRAVIEWTSAHPDDARAPEALYLAIRSTRYGCATVETAKLSKQAFDVLHSKYPASPWAAKTKYWYGAN